MKSKTPPLDDLCVKYAERILKHVTDSYYPNNVWFTNVTPILKEFADEVRHA